MYACLFKLILFRVMLLRGSDITTGTAAEQGSPRRRCNGAQADGACLKGCFSSCSPTKNIVLPCRSSHPIAHVARALVLPCCSSRSVTCSALPLIPSHQSQLANISAPSCLPLALPHLLLVPPPPALPRPFLPTSARIGSRSAPVLPTHCSSCPADYTCTPPHP